MAAINPANTLNFVPADAVLSQVMEELNSFNAGGLLDPGAFYAYIHTLLHNLGAAVYDEQEALIRIDKYVGNMPGNFAYIWDAYKVKPCNDTSNTLDVMQGGYMFYTDVTTELVPKPCPYEIDVPKCIDYTTKVTVRDYMRQPVGKCKDFNFCAPEMLSFGLTPTSGLYDAQCPLFRCASPNKINITKKVISSTFYDGWILLRYYGLAIDKATSLPMIPENPNVERALVYDIEFRVLRKLYLNNTVPDLERRVQMVEAHALDALQNASAELKTPSFGQMIKAARINNRRFSAFQMRRTDRVWPITY